MVPFIDKILIKNSRYFIPLIILLGIVLLLSIFNSENNKDILYSGSISGRIINSETGKPIKEVRISTNPITCVIKTDENGNFSFNNIPAGSYMISSKKAGFDNKIIDLDVNKNENQKIIIKINKKNDVVGLNPILETPSYLILNSVVSSSKIKKEKNIIIDNKTEAYITQKQKHFISKDLIKENNLIEKNKIADLVIDKKKETFNKSNVNKYSDPEIYFIKKKLSGLLATSEREYIHNVIYSKNIINQSFENVNEYFNNSVINQNGFGNFAELDIVDNFNTVIINETGSGNISKISQNGVFNKVKINQKGN